jgi:transaldolase
MNNLKDLKIKLFADGANLDGMLSLYKDPNINGFTTNPTLMKKAGITDYEKFAKQVLLEIPDRPVSFEVFANVLQRCTRSQIHNKYQLDYTYNYSTNKNLVSP